jgi:hypothetical protein
MQLGKRSAFGGQLSAFGRQLSVISCQFAGTARGRSLPAGFHPSSFILHPSSFILLPAPNATSGTCNVAQKVVRKRPAVMENTIKQASSERGWLAEAAEVQREIDFCATLQKCCT